MSGFMKTVLKKSCPTQKFFFSPETVSKIDNIKIIRNVSLFHSSDLLSLLFSLSCFSSLGMFLRLQES